ncbi:MAG TPA: GyrI-like domain-containing protein [Acidimicrobiia bacterium]|nr:GyrI-like domain-containing protein [Acidimicrobiia bacterium]
MVIQVDFKKQYKAFYSPKVGRPELKEIPAMQFLMVEGRGAPGSDDYQDAVQALYSVVYGIRFGRKKAGRDTFTVGPLEGLWWTEKGEDFSVGQPDDWVWTAMIWVPDFVTADEVAEAVASAQAKTPNPALAGLRLDVLNEGLVVQIMHVGPYTEEQPNIDKMHALAAEQGLIQSGKHHEIYLSDPRRAEPDKLRTIVRHPVAPTVG